MREGGTSFRHNGPTGASPGAVAQRFERARGRGLPGRGGFTLLELVMIIAIIAVVAVTAFVKWPFTDTNALVQAENLSQDLRYAQSLAMALARTGERVTVTFGSSGYVISDPKGSTVKNVTLAPGVTVTASNFSGGIVRFDGMGRPYSGSTLMSSAISLTVTAGGATKTVNLSAGTGAISVQ